MVIIKSIKHKAKFMSNMSFEGRKLSFLAILLYVSLREKIQMQSYFWSVFSVFGLNREIHEKNNNYIAHSVIETLGKGTF